MKLVSHPDKCTGCRICEIICSITKDQTINPRTARIHIATAYPGIVDYPVVCRQCEIAPCVAACPVKAITVDEETGGVLVNTATCTGCQVCGKACPYGAVKIDFKDGRKVSIICDLCGGQPECVEWCPFAAIELKT